MRLRRLTYASRVLPTIAATDLKQILGLAEVLHRRHDLTGVLAFTGRHFFQVIEGTAEEVDSLVHLIRTDVRHDQIHVLCDEDVSRRLFDRWYGVFIDSLDVCDQVAAAHVEQATECHRARHLINEIAGMNGQTS
jgi:hypothetical protein